MTISCFPVSEAQIRRITERLKEMQLFEHYGEQAHGESIMVSINTKSFVERQAVKTILQDAGITEFFYTDENAA